MIDGLDSEYRTAAGIKAHDLLRLHINNLNCMTERKSAHLSTSCKDDENVMKISKQEICSVTHSFSVRAISCLPSSCKSQPAAQRVHPPLFNMSSVCVYGKHMAVAANSCSLRERQCKFGNEHSASE